jgi:thiol-disulfide isomerase/thioredoxin
VGDASIGSSLNGSSSASVWRARASVLYGYLTADRRYRNDDELVSDANDPELTGDGMRMAFQMAILTAGVDAPWGTGLSFSLPLATMTNQNNTIFTTPRVTPLGPGDAEFRVRHDVGQYLELAKLRVGASAGAVLATGSFDPASTDALSIGRGVPWWYFGGDASYDLHERVGVTLNGEWRQPVGETPEVDHFAFRWGNEFRSSLGVRYTQPISGPAWLPSRLLVSVTGDYQYRGWARQVKTLFDDDSNPYTVSVPTEVGGHLWSVTPTLMVPVGEQFFVSVAARVPVYRDLYGNPDLGQLTPNTQAFFTLGGSFGLTEAAPTPRIDVNAGPKPGDEPKLAELNDKVVAGKWTLLDYWATWCKPCQRLGVELEEFAARHPDVALHRLDATDWERDVWLKFLPDSNGLPVIDVYGPDRKLRQRLIGEAADGWRALLPADLPETASPATH